MKQSTVFVKIVLVGDVKTGKTSLLHRYATDSVYEGRIPTIHDDYSQHKTLNINGQNIVIRVGFFDTAAHEDYLRLRPLCYPEATVIFYCFAIDSKRSLSNIESMWIPEVHHQLLGEGSVEFERKHNEKILIEYLVACKCDLKKDAEYWHKLVSGYIRQQRSENETKMPQELMEMCVCWIFDKDAYQQETAQGLVNDEEVKQLLDNDKFERMQKYVQTSALEASNVKSLFEDAIKASVEIQLKRKSKSCVLL